MEPPYGCTYIALIIVVAERRYNLIRIILGVDVKERDRCLFIVALGTVPDGRMMHEWDPWVESLGEQLSSLSGPKWRKIWPRIPSWGGGLRSPLL